MKTGGLVDLKDIKSSHLKGCVIMKPAVLTIYFSLCAIVNPSFPPCDFLSLSLSYYNRAEDEVIKLSSNFSAETKKLDNEEHMYGKFAIFQRVLVCLVIQDGLYREGDGQT